MYIIVCNDKFMKARAMNDSDPLKLTRLKRATAYVGTCAGREISHRGYEHQLPKTASWQGQKTFSADDYRMLKVYHVSTDAKRELFVNTTKQAVFGEGVLQEHKSEFYRNGSEAAAHHNAPVNTGYRHVRSIIPNITQQMNDDVVAQWETALLNETALDLPQSVPRYECSAKFNGIKCSYSSRDLLYFAYHMHAVHHCYCELSTLAKRRAYYDKRNAARKARRANMTAEKKEAYNAVRKARLCKADLSSYHRSQT
ncbi:hypothetical protein M3Y98_00070900 [Aphelenchoides besseyi]|nr:hypothetical protein M3Y98_00070900 [Aphelenchoides besseyi]KAI6198760.1 hypothetical protein M3Y96_00553500 [Aphelenchoides besseyi]